jgi:hypothetical protein
MCQFELVETKVLLYSYWNSWNNFIQLKEMEPDGLVVLSKDGINRSRKVPCTQHLYGFDVLLKRKATRDKIIFLYDYNNPDLVSII